MAHHCIIDRQPVRFKRGSHDAFRTRWVGSRGGMLQGAHERQRPIALLGLEISISAAHGEPIMLTNGWSSFNHQCTPAPIRCARHGGHIFQDAQLLKVFLAKYRDCGLREVEEPRHHLTHATKVRGAAGIF